MQTGKLIADGELAIRLMKDDDSDYERMIVWRNLPHVRRWWDPDLPPLTMDTVKQEHRPDTPADDPTTACIIELEGLPIGFIQFYKWSSYPDEASEVGVPFNEQTYGIDIFIGEPGHLNQGLGTRVMRLISDYFIQELLASSVALTTSNDNHAAQRCYEKAGFAKIKEVLDTDTYRGERVKSWLMVRPGSSGREPSQEKT